MMMRLLSWETRENMSLTSSISDIPSKPASALGSTVRVCQLCATLSSKNRFSRRGCRANSLLKFFFGNGSYQPSQGNVHARRRKRS